MVQRSTCNRFNIVWSCEQHPFQQETSTQLSSGYVHNHRAVEENKEQPHLKITQRPCDCSMGHQLHRVLRSLGCAMRHVPCCDHTQACSSCLPEMTQPMPALVSVHRTPLILLYTPHPTAHSDPISFASPPLSMLGPSEIQRNLTPGLQFQTLCLCKQILQILGSLTRRLKKRDGMAGSGHPRRASVGTGSRLEGRKQG